MAKLRKVRRKQKFRYSVNRKRLKQKQESKGKFESVVVKRAWVVQKSAKANLKDMGLSYDPNVTIKSGFDKRWNEEKTDTEVRPSKAYVADILEKEAKAKRVRNFRLPDGQVRYLIYLLKKYGTDYKAMVKDKKNYNQETWKQIKAKIEKFKKIPEQYAEYLNSVNE
ncbi:hypothetical protein RN001_015405 [Aquatica leii]|uniref:Nucleolar protein 16 n=1 Tax=Aquatica leii TaxID=1421715 RepID=A0AAN7S6M5_9COLE|nr:hypothetical protein RN001_015405 [Aquatica leii]